MIVESLCRRNGFLQELKSPFEVVEYEQRAANLNAQINPAPEIYRRFGQVAQSLQRLFIVGYGIAKTRSRQSRIASLFQVCHRLVPDLAAKGVMRQLFDLVMRAGLNAGLERFNDLRVQRGS